MNLASSFATEMLKIAKARHYRAFREGDVEVLEGTRLLRRLPDDKEEALARIAAATMTAKPAGWSHGMVAVPKKEIGRLEDIGFSATRAAIPLPGERWFKRTWRCGSLHAHAAGPLYLFHWDEELPTRPGHVVSDVLPALRAKYLKDTTPFVRKIEDHPKPSR